MSHISEDREGERKPFGEDDMHPVSKALFGWVETPGIGRVLFWIMAVISLILMLLDFASDRYSYFTIEKVRGFYGFLGFSAFTFVVLTGWPLGKLLRRDENYYDDADDEGEGS